MQKSYSRILPAVIAGLSALLILSSSCGRRDTGLPLPDHIVIVIEENHGFDQIMDSGFAPYIGQLARAGMLFTDAHGVTHPSQPNYLAIFSGSTQGVKDDRCLIPETPFVTPNLGAALIKAGYSFKGYGETMPFSGYRGCDTAIVKGYQYVRKHIPWVNWLGDKDNGLPDAVSQPLSEVPADFSKLPTVSFVIPNEGNDMHNIIGGDSATIVRGDQWLKDHLSGYVNWAMTHNSLFILTFDEDNFTLKNQIPTIFAGAMVWPGKYDTTINHYNVLGTIEAMYGLPPSGAAKSAVIRGIWK